jgi:type IV secretory pathway VirB4 component
MSTKPASKPKAPSTQRYLPIQEIKDGVVILKDGTLRAVLLVSSINFALKSDEEQEAIVGAYVGFLNSLSHPMQILVQSRRLQIKPYLDNLLGIEKEQTNELLRMQIADYRAFVAELVEIGQIMTKRFYVIVPYDPLSNKKKNFLARLKETLKPTFTLRLKEERFKQRKKDLDMRLRLVQSGLSSIGLSVIQLDTQALIELFYSSYNPDTAFAEELTKVEELRIES